MIAVVQRARRAVVRAGAPLEEVGRIERGVVVLLAVERSDGPAQAAWMARKLAALRIFEDDQGRMNLPLAAVGGGVLLVSQFTLAGDVREGNRPSFVRAAPPEEAEPLFRQVGALLAEAGLPVAWGRFRTAMEVELVNDGPVTLVVQTPGPAGEAPGKEKEPVAGQ